MKLLYLKNRKLRQDLEKAVETVKYTPEISAEIKVNVYDIATGINTSVNGRNPGWAASIIKVPILVEAVREICDGRLDINETLMVDHRFVLEDFDPVSMMPNGTKVGIMPLLQYMIVNSDNTATNMIADRIGVKNINHTMWDLGMKRSMMGHLLCPGVPRYKNKFNPDGSNITCPNDMTLLFRQIYDPKFSDLSEQERELSDRVLSLTHSAYLNTGEFSKSKVKAKIGVINDPKDGADVHEVGIIDDHLIVSIMMNKVHQQQRSTMWEIWEGQEFSGISPVRSAYDEIMRTISQYFKQA